MGNIKRWRAGSEDSDYKVGYGSPPRQSQFKVGRSGNPKGRPKRARNFKTDVNATLLTPVKVAREGKMRKISTQAAMLLRLREKALGGDARSLDRLIALAQTYGDDEPTVSMDLSVEDELVLQVYRRRLLSGAVPEFIPIDPSIESITQAAPAQRPIHSDDSGRKRPIQDGSGQGS